MDEEKELKNYTKPILKIHGDLKDITQGGQSSGTEPRTHQYKES